MKDRHLLAIDGTNILRTVYEANPAPNSPQKADAALSSAVGSFLKILKTHNPTHVFPAFDFPGKNWRHDVYPEYKANRSPMPEELRVKIPVFFDMLQNLGIVPVQKRGYEAEDLIATAFSRWQCPDGVGSEPRGSCTVVSSDKDLLILLSEGAKVVNYFKDENRDEDYVLRKFFVPSSKFRDALALVGDTSDNVPGVEKIGPKTAGKLLDEYGDFFQVLAAAEHIKGVVGENLRAQIENAMLSYELVELKRDVVLGVSWNQLAYHVDSPENMAERGKKALREINKHGSANRSYSARP